MRKTGLLIAVLLLSALVWHTPAQGQETLLKPWADVIGDYPASTLAPNDDPTGLLAGGIVWSRHNLSSYGPVFQASREEAYSSTFDTGENCIEFPPLSGNWICVKKNQVATTQICVFCHTPHHSRRDTDVGPLWNKGNVANYVAYDYGGPNKTMAGTPTDVSGSSLTCLGCHDGITTFDSLINAPGSGSNTDGTATNYNWTWSMWNVDNAYPAGQQYDHFRDGAGGCHNCHPQSYSDRLNIGLGPSFSVTYGPGNVTPTGGTADLTNDHPIGVAYSTDGRASLRPMSTTLVSLEMYNVKSLDPGYANAFGRSDNYWSVFGYINTGATIANLLRGDNRVECASCHDPHYKNQTNDDPSLISSYTRTGGAGGFEGEFNRVVTTQTDELIDGLFLRRVGGNSNSGVCRTCHQK